MSFCIPSALAETWPPSPGDVGWVNPRTTAGSQANNIPLIKLPKQPSCFYWVQGHLLFLFLFICHIATCTFYLFPLSRAGLETGTMNEWMNRGIDRTSPSIWRMLSVGVWMMSLIRPWLSLRYIFFNCTSVFWLERTSLCGPSVHSCLEKRSERSGRAEWVMDEWDGRTPGIMITVPMLCWCSDKILIDLLFLFFKQRTFVLSYCHSKEGKKCIKLLRWKKWLFLLLFFAFLSKKSNYFDPKVLFTPVYNDVSSAICSDLVEGGSRRPFH